MGRYKCVVLGVDERERHLICELCNAACCILWRFSIADEQRVRVADELAADGNVDGGLLLVACDDPYLQQEIHTYA